MTDKYIDVHKTATNFITFLAENGYQIGHDDEADEWIIKDDENGHEWRFARDGTHVSEKIKAIGQDDEVMLSKAFRILGQFADSDGAGIVGHNTAETGDAIGVEGATESDDGYGLFTEDDAHVGGELSSESVSTDKARINGSELALNETPDEPEEGDIRIVEDN